MTLGSIYASIGRALRGWKEREQFGERSIRLPPWTTLIVAPEVSTLRVAKPGNNGDAAS